MAKHNRLCSSICIFDRWYNQKEYNLWSWWKKIDQRKLDRALQLAQIKDFVNSLPEKENTIVGERGVKISEDKDKNWNCQSDL